MPNWNTSEIKISLNPHARLTPAEKQVRWEVWRDLRNILDKWVKDGCDKENSPDVFQIIHPRPKEQDEDWYDWNTDNWGTKWDMRVFNYSFENDEIRFYGETAWNPPIGILNKLVSLGFNMKHLFASMENEDWGYHINRNEGGLRIVGNRVCYTHRMYDDNLEDFSEAREDAEDLSDDEIQQLATLFTLTGEFIFNIPEGLHENDLHFFEAELYSIVDANSELLQDHIENSSNGEIEEFKELRNEIMESLDDLKDKGYVNDGFYLQWCNHLKRVQQREMNKLHAMSKFIYLVKEKRHDMIQYYTATHAKQEPTLIKMYEVF